jgi:hypothetical protein
MLRLLLTLVALGILSTALVGCHAEGGVGTDKSVSSVGIAR